VPGLGAIATGPDARTARVNADVAARSHLVTARTLDAFGAVEWLDEADVFDFDYWPLELYKLQSAPPPREFSGHVAIVSGAESALRQAVADRLTREGAHLILANGDPVSAAVAAFGGVDILIALDPISHDEQERLARALQQQGIGGAVVGLETAQGTTIDLRQPMPDGVRFNVVQTDERADPSLVAEAIAFLASSRSATTDRATVPVGAVSEADGGTPPMSS
jgi:NAD(P)-dependent dehydrogenase (short-subunit alcohol dehydrogenase family)